MRPQAPFPANTAARMRQLLKQAKTVPEALRIQAILMRASSASSPQEIAAATGLAINTIRLLHSKFLRQGESILVDCLGRGGRRKAKLSKADEAAFLKQFHDAAEAGKVITVDEIKQAFENLVGHAVNVSSIYRLMARAGWRKIVPRPRHPKKKPDAEEGFKKSIWSPSPPPN